MSDQRPTLNLARVELNALISIPNLAIGGGGSNVGQGDGFAPILRLFKKAPMTAQLYRQSNTLGIVLAGTSFAFFALADAIAKLMADTYHPVQVAGLRQLGLLAGVLLWIAIKGTKDLRTQQPKLQIFRGLCASLSAVLFVFALRYVPLADATTIAFVAPFFVTILGSLFLNEPIGPRRWFAVGAGFTGTLIVMRPGFEGFHPAYLLVLVAALLFATRQLISRNLSTTESTVSTVAFTAGVSAVVLGIGQIFVWKPIASEHILLFVIYGILAAVGELLVIKALEIALAVAVAPMQYTMIIWTSILGYLIFGQTPDTLTLIGTTIIIVSGLFTIWREYQLGRQRSE